MQLFTATGLVAAVLASAMLSAAGVQSHDDTARGLKKMVPPAQAVSPSSGCIIEQVVQSNNSLQGLNLLRHGADPLNLVDTDATSFTCVDARTEHPMVGAFAGDIGEFLTGLDAYRQLCTLNQMVPTATVKMFLKAFVQQHTTSMRPFYMHTDNTSLAALLTAMGADSFPTVEPEAQTKQMWFDTMFQNKTRYHGCGHLWYQIAFPDEYDADVNLTYSLLQSFFELFWDPLFADRIRYELVLGAMNAHAVAIVETESKGSLRGANKCADQVVPLRPRFCPNGCPATNVRDFRKSQNYSIGPEYDVFTFHLSAVERHRKKVSVPFFMKRCPAARGVTAKAFHEKLNSIADLWAESSLHHLNALPDQKPHITMRIKLQSRN